MLTKFKVFGIRVKHEYYCRVASYWIDEADIFIKNGNYEDACKCWVNVRKYIEKQAALFSKLIEMA